MRFGDFLGVAFAVSSSIVVSLIFLLLALHGGGPITLSERNLWVLGAEVVGFTGGFLLFLRYLSRRYTEGSL